MSDFPTDPRFAGCFATFPAGSDFDPGSAWLCILGCYAMVYMDEGRDSSQHDEDDRARAGED